MSKNIIKYLLLMFVALVVSCKDKTGSDIGQGTLKLDFINDNGTNTKAAKEDRIYKIEVFDMDGNVVATYSDHTQTPSITLDGGQYRVVATNGNDQDADFDAPFYKGEAAVTITVGGTTSTTIVAKLANVKVTVNFSDVIKNNFTTYDVVVTNATSQYVGGELTFDKTMTNRAAYLKASGSITWTLNLVNLQGTPFTITKTIVGVEARDHYKLNFSINPNEDDTGGGVLGLVIDNSTDIVEHDYEINIKKKPEPVISGEGFDISQSVLVNETVRGASARVNFNAQATLQELTIKHDSPTITALGVPVSFMPTNLSEELKAQINGAGIGWNSPILEATMGWIDFSNIANKLPLGDYWFDMSFYDAQKQLVVKKLKITVIPDQDHMTLGCEPWAKFAILRGQWNTVTKPEGMTFEYRKDSESAWTTFDASQIVVGENKTFIARVIGLSPDTKYHFRTSAPATKQANVMTFTTEAAPLIPNLSFEEGGDNGSSWYPNADLNNSYWATGNDGTTINMAGMPGKNTYHTNDAVSGKAVYMISKAINNILSPVKFAAGNLFTGEYSTDMGNPKNSVKFGRPYTGRPIAVQGWYKYRSNAINSKNAPGNVAGTPDRCHIYLQLEDWGGASSRPSNPKIVAYGEFQSDQTVTQYTKFRFDVVYNDKTVKPTHVTMAATSSYLGGDFVGGIDSELFVDEFELIFE